MRLAIRGLRDRTPESAWEEILNSAAARHPWIVRPGGTLAQMLDRIRLAYRTSLRRGDLFRRPEIQTSAVMLDVVILEDRLLTMAEGGDGSPIRLPRNVAQVERCPVRRRGLLPDRVPGFHGPRIRCDRDLLEVTGTGGSSRRNLEGRWKEGPWTGAPWKEALRKIRAEFPEARMGRAECLRIQSVRTRREATPGRRWK
jgi:hypothetical protein